MGHKAKPIKPFLRQNKKAIFQYATEERAEQSDVSRTYKLCLTPGYAAAQLMASSRLLI